MKSLSLLLSLAVLGIVGVSLWPAAAPQPSEVVEQPRYLTGTAESERLWAQALLESVRATDEAGRERARSAFAAALDGARHKAPIYLTIASQEWLRFEPFGSAAALRRELDLRAGVLSARLAEVARRNSPQDRLTQHVLESLRTDLEKWRTSDADEEGSSGPAALLTRPDGLQQLCLEAAAGEDPTCAVAWSRLAMGAEPVRAQSAAETWRKLEPDNAAAHYALALALDAQGIRESAIESLSSGNACRECEFPRPSLPIHFVFAYPDDASLQEVAGERVTPAGLGNLVYLQTRVHENADAPARVRSLAVRLADGVEAVRADAAVQQLADCLRQLGVRLLTGDDADASQVRHGLAILHLGTSVSQAIDGRPALAGFDPHLQRSTRELSAGLVRWTERSAQLLENRRRLLRGEIDLRDEELRAMRQLLEQPRLQAALAARTSPSAK